MSKENPGLKIKILFFFFFQGDSYWLLKCTWSQPQLFDQLSQAACTLEQLQRHPKVCLCLHQRFLQPMSVVSQHFSGLTDMLIWIL